MRIQLIDIKPKFGGRIFEMVYDTNMYDKRSCMN